MMKNSLALFLALSATAGMAQDLTFKERRSMNRMKSHVDYLASDALEGRASGTQGELLSAEYIAKQFKKNGLKPLGSGGSYLQSFDFATLRMANKGCELLINGTPYKLFTDFYPLSYSSNNGTFSGQAVFVGSGIASESLNTNDYQDLNVKGKAVFINYGLPESLRQNPASAPFEGIELRVKEAINRGASAVIFYKSSKEQKGPDGNLSLHVRGTVPVLFLNKTPESYSEVPVKIGIDILELRDTARNVVGFKDNKSDKTVIVCAHHDHLGKGEVSGSRETIPGSIHNGADDNASGVAVMLELAKRLKRGKSGLKEANYLFIAFSGEEMGLLGSKFYTENPLRPLTEVSYVMNLDMVGRLDSVEKTLMINGVGTSPVWKSALDLIQADTNKLHIKTSEGGMGASDHTSFYLKQVPAVHFFTGQHHDYHKSSDDVEKLNYAGQVWIASYMVSLMKHLSAEPKLTFTPTADSSQGRMRFKVTLGIMPDYIYSGEGLKLDGVKEGGPAQKAGLEAGDIIIRMNDRTIANIRDYMTTLSELDKGQDLKIVLKRKESILEKNVKL